MDLRISRIEVYPVNIEKTVGKEVAVTYGLLRGLTNVVVKIFTEDGPHGWGEGAGSTDMFFFNGESQESVRAALSKIAPSLLGQDALNLNEIHEKMNLVPRNQAKCAIDVALHDIIGKALKRPVHQLLGGAFSQEAPMHSTVGISSPTEMAAQAIQRVEQGYRTLEIKVGKYEGRVSVEGDVARVRAVRDAIGNDVILIVDANVGWDVHEAIRIIRKIEELDVLIEQPTRNLEGLREIRKNSSAPIIADESCQGLQDTVRIIQMEAADMISMKITKFAGFTESRRVLSLCEAFGLGYRYDNMNQSRLSATASLHLTMAFSKGIPSGGTNFLSFQNDLVSQGGLRIDRGIARLEDSEAPGLGIEIAEDLLGEPDTYVP